MRVHFVEPLITHFGFCVTLTMGFKASVVLLPAVLLACAQ